MALAALSLVAGLLAGLGGSAEAWTAGGALAVAIVGLAAVMRDERGPLVAAALLGIAVGGAVIGLGERSRAAADCRRGWRSGQRVRVEALAVGYLPEGERGSVRFRPGTDSGDRCEWAGELRAWAEGPLRPGARYELRGRWQPAQTPARAVRAPARWGWIVIDSLAAVEEAHLPDHPFLMLRGSLADRLWRIYPRRWAPLAQALVLGQRETMSPETTRRIANAGLAHLLAISGLHVGMIAAALFALGRIGRLSLGGARAFALCITCAYVALIGAPPSAVRAGLMVGLWTLARAAGRASSAFDVLGLAALILLLARPWSVAEPGFQLSFAGAAAVGYAHAEARRFLWRGRLPRVVRGLVIGAVSSAAAVLLTAPITAAFFGRVAPAAIVGNLAAIPLLALALPALFASALVAPWPALAAWPAGAAVLVLGGIDQVARTLGSAPLASFELAPPGLILALFYLTLLVLGAHAVHGAWQRRRFILALGVIGAVILAGPPLKARFATPGIAVYVIDVGQGDGIAVRTRNRHWLLIDAGPRIHGFDAGALRVLPFFREQGVRSLEAWIASHPDLDHVGGFPSVSQAVQVERVIGVGFVTGQIGQVAVLRQILTDSLLWLKAAAGSALHVDGLELTFLHPPDDIGASGVPEPNELSLVFALRYGEFRMLFTGDVPGAVEDRLSRIDSVAVRAQILKVSHHGSASSTSRLFLDAVRPQLAVISVGRANRYGHPSSHTLRRLMLHGIPVRRTDRDGTVVIEARADGSWRARTAAEGF